ncbi:MAG: hypothetical protein ACK46Z_06275, partial [Bacteroidota bacterium]
MKKNVLRFTVVTLCWLLFSQHTTQAQVVWESPQKEIYPYLERMAQKGLIQFNDLIRPLSRQYLASCLDSLGRRMDQLTAVEKKEWLFYAREYGNEMDTSLFRSGKDFVSGFRKDP